MCLAEIKEKKKTNKKKQISSAIDCLEEKKKKQVKMVESFRRWNVISKGKKLCMITKEKKTKILSDVALTISRAKHRKKAADKFLYFDKL